MWTCRRQIYPLIFSRHTYLHTLHALRENIKYTEQAKIVCLACIIMLLNWFPRQHHIISPMVLLFYDTDLPKYFFSEIHKYVHVESWRNLSTMKSGHVFIGQFWHDTWQPTFVYVWIWTTFKPRLSQTSLPVRKLPCGGQFSNLLYFFTDYIVCQFIYRSSFQINKRNGNVVWMTFC